MQLASDTSASLVLLRGEEFELQSVAHADDDMFFGVRELNISPIDHHFVHLTANLATQKFYDFEKNQPF